MAINEFNNAIKLNPNYAEAYDNRGFTYFVKLGNKVKGCADLKKACELGECRNYNLAKQKGYCS
jgi:tetratricopeptide (TPR) repeat protein